MTLNYKTGYKVCDAMTKKPVSVSPETSIGRDLQSYIPSTLISAKLLMLTIPLVIYGVGRYLYVIYEKSEGESPERVLLDDKPLFYTAIFWIIFVILITN